MDNLLCDSTIDEDDIPLSCLIEREKSLEELPLSHYKTKQTLDTNVEPTFNNENNITDLLFNAEYQQELNDLTVTVLEDNDDFIPPGSIVLNAKDIPVIDKNLICRSDTDHDSNAHFSVAYPSDIINPGDNGQKEETATSITLNQLAESTNSYHKMHESRKRKRNVEHWKQTIRKRRREVGKEYINKSGKLVSERLSKTSSCNCKFNCSKISAEIREEVFHSYWRLTYEGKRSFLQQHVRLIDKKRNSNQKENSRRKNTLEYFIPIVNNRVQVCKAFFLKALDIKEKTVHYNIKVARGSTDKRGKSTKPKISEQSKEEVKQHINSYPTVDSHYCRSTSKRKYLPKNLSVRKMYKEYCEKCTKSNISPQKFWIYNKIFNEDFNLGFHKPKKDLCSFCESFKSLPADMQRSKQSEYDLHQKNKEEARSQKNADKSRALESNKEIRILNFDLQKVLLCPKTSIGEVYYSRKYTTYNFTVFDCVSKIAECYMWHEIIGKRGSCEIASCLYEYNKSVGPVQELIYYSDSCTGQQRNLPFSCMCMFSVENLPIEKITHNYFERGHSQMEGDTVHAAIERHTKKIDIFIPDEWMHAVQNSKYTHPKFRVNKLSQTEIFDFKMLSDKCIMNRKISSDNLPVKWNKIKSFQYRKSSPNIIFYKYEISSEWSILDTSFVRSRKKDGTLISMNGFQLSNLYNGYLPISSMKYKDLQNLCKTNVIPNMYHHFYESLPHKNIVSRLPEPNESDFSDGEIV